MGLLRLDEPNLWSVTFVDTCTVYDQKHCQLVLSQFAEMFGKTLVFIARVCYTEQALSTSEFIALTGFLPYS